MNIPKSRFMWSTHILTGSKMHETHMLDFSSLSTSKVEDAISLIHRTLGQKVCRVSGAYSFTNFCNQAQLQMLLFPNALCCSPYERNCVRAVTKLFTKFLPANNFCQLLWVTRKRSCTSAGNAQAQLHFQDDQQRAFGISNISNWATQ